MTEAAGIDVVVFDLGGVLVETHGSAFIGPLIGTADRSEIWRRWLLSEWVRRYERGGCSGDEFARGIVAEFGLAVAPAVFLESFRQWVGAPFPGAFELLDEVGRRCATACLSNTNALHWSTHRHLGELAAKCRWSFLSFELGVVKPDPEMFAYAADALQIAPARLLLLDDNSLNVEAARMAGWQAERVYGADGARTALAARGLAAALSAASR